MPITARDLYNEPDDNPKVVVSRPSLRLTSRPIASVYVEEEEQMLTAAPSITVRKKAPFQWFFSAWPNFGDHPVVVIIATIAATITIVTFVTKGSSLEAVVRIFRPDPIAQQHFNRGVNYLFTEEHERAIFEFTKAIEIDSGRSEYYLHRGIAYKEAGNHDNAISDFSAVLKNSPNNIAAYIHRSLAYRAIGNTESAIDDLFTAINIFPDDPILYYHRAELYVEIANYESAILDYRECSSPKHKEAGELRRMCVQGELKVIQKWNNANPLPFLMAPLQELFPVEQQPTE